MQIQTESGNGRSDEFFILKGNHSCFMHTTWTPRPVQGNMVFHVWGEKAGVKEVAHSLGILHKDDGQSRWAMTFDDPRVLVKINSVFVTTEVASKQYKEPHGKKVLYAYWGNQPNHP